MEIIKIDVEDKNYPQRLLKIKNFPTEIYAVGNVELLNAKNTLGIVGARKCTEYGRTVTSEFAKQIARQGVCIISGMAVGIDAMAHNSAIEEKGKTIAVLGGGFNHIYPLENEWLFHKIIEKGGCVITEYPPEIEADNTKFPTRNRIISALSDAVLVVEARHRSGSTITAKYARKQEKAVYAIPNTIYTTTGVGTNNLIREGAILVTKPEQIIEKIQNQEVVNDDSDVKVQSKKINNSKIAKVSGTTKDSGSKKKNEQINEVTKIGDIMPKEYLEVYRVLSDKPMHINEISKILNKPIQEINSLITIMEIEGYALQTQPNYFSRSV